MKPAMRADIQRSFKFLFWNLEAIIWLAVIVYFTISSMQFNNHFAICPLRLAGFEHCPGCGLGRSLVLLLHGRITESFEMHPLGLLALALFISRIFTVFRNYFKYRKHVNANELLERAN